MTLFTLISALIGFISACIGVYVASRAWIEYYRVHNRLETVEERIQSLHGKLHRDKRTTRDEIRDAVDQYLGTLDLESAGSMDGDMLQMMMAQMMGGAMGPAQADAEPQGDAARETDSPLPTLMGSGGT
jgi:hypothetical protein